MVTTFASMLAAPRTVSVLPMTAPTAGSWRALPGTALPTMRGTDAERYRSVSTHNSIASVPGTAVVPTAVVPNATQAGVFGAAKQAAPPRGVFR